MNNSSTFITSNTSILGVNMRNTSISSISSYEVTRDSIVLFLYLITAVLAIIGNVFVCLVVYKKANLRSTTYKLVVNMAVSDIIGGLSIPLQWLFCATFLLDKGVFAQRVCGTLKSIANSLILCVDVYDDCYSCRSLSTYLSSAFTQNECTFADNCYMAFVADVHVYHFILVAYTRALLTDPGQ